MQLYQKSYLYYEILSKSQSTKRDLIGYYLFKFPISFIMIFYTLHLFLNFTQATLLNLFCFDTKAKYSLYNGLFKQTNHLHPSRLHQVAGSISKQAIMLDKVGQKSNKTQQQRGRLSIKICLRGHFNIFLRVIAAQIIHIQVIFSLTKNAQVQ